MNLQDIQLWFSKNDLEFLYRSPYPLLTIDLYFHSTKTYRTTIGNQQKNFLFLGKMHEVTAYYSTTETISTEKARKFLEKNFAKKHFEKSKKAIQEYDEFIHSLQKKQSFSKKELLTSFNLFWTINQQLVSFFRSSRPEIVDPLVKELYRIIDSSLQNEDAQSAKKYLATPFEEDMLKKEEKAWLKILETQPAKDCLLEHAEKYSWILEDCYTAEQAIDFLTNKYFADTSVIQSRKSDQENINHYELAAKKRLHFLSLLPPKAKDVSTVIIKHAKERLEIKTRLMGSYFQARIVFVQLAKLASVPISDFIAGYMYEDVKNLVTKNKAVSKDKLDGCKKGYVYMVQDLEKQFFVDRKVVDFFNGFVAEKFSTLSGDVASKGYATGTAYVPKQSDRKIQQGEILVCPSTEPNMLPIMKLASAIVTDQGGLTSHAAIVSRELGIPCVVGVKGASTSIISGQRIEVDAKTGVIKLLDP